MMQEQITEMFNEIAPGYDRLNTLLSVGIDRYWRWKMVSLLPKKEKLKLLDCATGTGDQLLTFFKYCPQLHQAIGIDLADKMLEKCRDKLRRYLHATILKQASVTELPFLEESFDCVTISFGIRNIDNPLKALQEMRRVLKQKGRILVLEFSLPSRAWIQTLYLFYLNTLLPKIGKCFSSHPYAYSYLSDSIQVFPQGEKFCNLMIQIGFEEVQFYPLTGGIVTIYSGSKKA